MQEFFRAQQSIVQGNFRSLRDELAFHSTRVNRQNAKGEAHLHLACREGYVRAVKFLLDPKNCIRVRLVNGSQVVFFLVGVLKLLLLLLTSSI